MEKLSTKFTTTRTVADIRQLVEYDILMKADNGDGDEVNFTVPVMIDVVGSLVTPDQDVALKRQAFKSAHDYYVGAIAKARERSFVPDDEQDVKYFPVLSSFVARLARAAGSLDVYKRCLMESWEFTLMVTGPQGALDPDLRLRMEQRLGTEARRNPEHATLALFERFEVKPLLTEYRSQDHYDPVHHPMTLVTSLFERGHYIQPPIALAAISGEVQKMVWGLLNDHLDHTKPPNEKFLEPGQRQYLRVDIDAYMAVIEKFEGKVPKSTDPPHPSCPKTLAEEKALITFITSYAANVEGVNDRLVKFFDYYDHVIMCRRDRLVKFVQSISDIEAFRAKGNSITAGAMKSAFALFVRPPPIPSAVVHKALLVLATAGWQTKYFSSNLQSIRDAVLRQRTATEYDFKAFLFCNLAFGEEITSATMRAA